jgi:acyl-CoA thioester hydrolase
MPVEPGWLDYNGHLNVAYYGVLFDRATDDAFAGIGLGAGYVRERGGSIFALEILTGFLREIGANDTVVVETQLLDHDAKRIHFFHTMRHATAGFVAATSEHVCVHVDMTTRRSAPFPPDIAARLKALAASHALLPRPERAGRRIGLRRQ